MSKYYFYNCDLKADGYDKFAWGIIKIDLEEDDIKVKLLEYIRTTLDVPTDVTFNLKALNTV